jgi:hypothetical protein
MFFRNLYPFRGLLVPQIRYSVYDQNLRVYIPWKRYFNFPISDYCIVFSRISYIRPQRQCTEAISTDVVADVTRPSGQTSVFLVASSAGKETLRRFSPTSIKGSLNASLFACVLQLYQIP